MAFNHQIWKLQYKLQVKTALLLLMVAFVSVLAGCGQKEVSTFEEPQQEEQQETESLPEPTAEPVNDNPEPIPEPLAQPQADGTGINFEFPEDWIENATEGMRDLQLMVNDDGNRVLYGVLRGYMDAQEIISVTLADSSTAPGEFVTGYDLQYNVTLDDGTLLRLNLTATGFPTDDGGDVVFDGIAGAYVYPQFANYYWSLDCENMEGWDDWVYQIINGNTTQYYSISNDSLEEYTMFDDYEGYSGDNYGDFGANDTPEEPTRLTQYDWPDYCDETDCLMMEAVGLEYHEQWGTATKLLSSGVLITISITPKISGGVEYGAKIRVDGDISYVSVTSSDGINYQCTAKGGKGGNMGGYTGKWISLTKDGWTNWY